MKTFLGNPTNKPITMHLVKQFANKTKSPPPSIARSNCLHYRY